MTPPTNSAKVEPTTTPRPGILGLWDRLVGPDSTTAESGLILGTGGIFTIGIIGYALLANLGWSHLQLVLVAAFAFDLAGGIPGNTTVASKRWWHRPSQRHRDHFLFAAFHIHPLVLAAMFDTVSWIAASVIYGYLLIATAVVLLVPTTLQLPVAMSMVTGGVLLSLYGPSLGIVFAWVAPFLYLKLVLGHSVGIPTTCSEHILPIQNRQ